MQGKLGVIKIVKENLAIDNYALCWMNTQVFGIDKKLCIRCNTDDETWDHVWECTENKVSLVQLRNLAINTVIRSDSEIYEELAVKLKNDITTYSEVTSEICVRLTAQCGAAKFSKKTNNKNILVT
ncbi:hypothetical protein RclHR1_00800025 [Rhizophagus clarus]|uniref:Uncharacterized protein n=1 Tax=Rhizophagus clarus TaxID=94130 RepID=A0A2Z6RZ07_9GLOM|nr:hypothetical protein RclHR1_00800025 [Rhizophagus clarus]